MNISLPVVEYKKEICEAVKNHPVTIIKADTGAGKSTQVPQFLLEIGYEVIVTQPRRLAAITLSEKVAEEMESTIGEIVGYRTAFECCDSKNTQLLFCTDGLELVRTIVDKSYDNREKVLIIDEVHEWNINIETLIAWCKKRIIEGWNTKVVIMSATLDTDSLNKYFGGNTPAINVPGRLFPVEERQSQLEIFELVKEFVNKRRNILIFVPGKREINEIMKSLEELDAIILPLHGELDSIEQRKCFVQYDKPKVIVSTNIAQTSITIPDIDAVIDTGKERRVEIEDGLEGLFICDISRADCIQRKGRAGRTKEGIYVLCSNTSIESRSEFPVPEIQRSILDQVVLRLASVGIDATQLEFFHQPNRENLLAARESLNNLGAFIGNKVTHIGHQMSKMPISVRYARIIIEANKLGVVDDVIAIAAILEVGSLIKRSKYSRYYHYTSENNSDLLAELDIWNKYSNNSSIDFQKEGIYAKNYYSIKRLIEKLKFSLQGIAGFNFNNYNNDRKLIVRACITGMVDYLYRCDCDGWSKKYTNGDQNSFELDRNSIIRYSPEWIVGIPKTIETKNKWSGSKKLNLISMVTKVEFEWIYQIAPQLFNIKEGIAPYYDGIFKCCISTTIIIYKDQIIKKEKVRSDNHPEAKILEQEWKSANPQKANIYLQY